MRICSLSYVNVRRPAFVLHQVPEGRHNVAHRGNGGVRVAIMPSPVGATHWGRSVSPLRGWALCPHKDPPLARWATFFRP